MEYKKKSTFRPKPPLKDSISTTIVSYPKFNYNSNKIEVNQEVAHYNLSIARNEHNCLISCSLEMLGTMSSHRVHCLFFFVPQPYKCRPIEPTIVCRWSRQSRRSCFSAFLYPATDGPFCCAQRCTTSTNYYTNVLRLRPWSREQYNNVISALQPISKPLQWHLGLSVFDAGALFPRTFV